MLCSNLKSSHHLLTLAWFLKRHFFVKVIKEWHSKYWTVKEPNSLKRFERIIKFLTIPIFNWTTFWASIQQFEVAYEHAVWTVRGFLSRCRKKLCIKPTCSTVQNHCYCFKGRQLSKTRSSQHNKKTFALP